MKTGKRRAAFLLSGCAALLADGFTLQPVCRPAAGCWNGARLAMRAEDESAPSYQEALKRARAAKSGQGQQAATRASPGAATTSVAAAARPAPVRSQEPPFSDELYTALKDAITVLTNRLNRRAPLTAVEYEQFGTAAALILADAVADETAAPTSIPAAAAAAAAPAAAAAAAPARRAVAAPSAADAAEKYGDVDDEDIISDTPEFDGEYGRAKGTTNTYFVEGMAGMQADEYQEALRAKLVSRAQAKRKTGSYGNIAANSYLKFLNKNPTFGEFDVEATEVDDEDFKTY